MDAEQRYDWALIAVLNRYKSGEAYGSQRPRECGHVVWDIVRDLPCVACLALEVDRERYGQLSLEASGGVWRPSDAA